MTITNMFDTLIKPLFGDRTLFTKFCSDKQNNRILVVYVENDHATFFDLEKVWPLFVHAHAALRILKFENFARPLSKSYREKI